MVNTICVICIMFFQFLIQFGSDADPTPDCDREQLWSDSDPILDYLDSVGLSDRIRIRSPISRPLDWRAVLAGSLYQKRVRRLLFEGRTIGPLVWASLFLHPRSKVQEYKRPTGGIFEERPEIASWVFPTAIKKWGVIIAQGGHYILKKEWLHKSWQSWQWWAFPGWRSCDASWKPDGGRRYVVAVMSTAALYNSTQSFFLISWAPIAASISTPVTGKL
jgi:hypothetical protein